MNQSDFEADLRREGYEVFYGGLKAGEVNLDHSHDWHARVPRRRDRGCGAGLVRWPSSAVSLWRMQAVPHRDQRRIDAERTDDRSYGSGKNRRTSRS
jgi:hypothetical protein